MVKTVLLLVAAALAVAVTGVLAYAATRPDSFRVERSATIDAPPEAIYAVLADLRRSVEWSPYETRDPAMTRTYSGAEQGKGAVYDWDGNKDVGAGRLTISDAAPPHRVTLRLDMLRPFTASNVVDYVLQPDGAATRVTWSMHGPVPYLAKVMHLFFDVDKMLGKDFEQGLASLKALVEKP